MSINKYRRLVDLYVTGKVVRLKDGTPLWLQVLSPFEREVVRKEAQIAQARQILAMKEHGSDEHDRVKAGFYSQGREAAVTQLVDTELNKNVGKILNDIRNDPEWTERLEILDRGAEDTNVPTVEEELLLQKIEVDFYSEIGKRAEDERRFLTDKFDALDDQALWEAFLDVWLERLGSQAAMAEFKIAQVSYSARVCEAVEIDTDTWEHHDCAEGHPERIWPTYADVRGLPDGLMAELTEALDELELTEREAKNSDRQTSSSGSSRLPSEVEASTASTPDETPVAPPGTSSVPSPTPSPSSDGLSYPTTPSHPSTSG